MPVFSNEILLGTQGKKTRGEAYQIDNSLRFNDNDTAYLTRTPASASNRKTWTWSGWVKRGLLGSTLSLFYAGTTSNDQTNFALQATGSDTDRLILFSSTSGATSINVDTAGIQYRDPTAWYHFVLSVDTTQATNSDGVKIWVNGVLQNSTYSTYTQDAETQVNNTIEHSTGSINPGTRSQYFDGYLSEVHLIDGQALSPTSFGEFDSHGVWSPIAYTGTYGTNGFYLDFEDSSDLGNDASGNANDWTPTSLVASDQVLDTPTNNFFTLNPLTRDAVTLQEGNLYANAPSYWSVVLSSAALPREGKWYIESLVGTRNGSYCGQGFVPANEGRFRDDDGRALYYGPIDYAITFNYGLGVATNGSGFGYYDTVGTTSYPITEPDGTTIQSSGELHICHAIDFDNERYWAGTAFSANTSVTWFGPSGAGADPTTPSTGLDISGYLAKFKQNLVFGHAPNNVSGNPYAYVNFGQDGTFAGNETSGNYTDLNGIGNFKYEPPSGFLALCSQNLPEPEYKDGEQYFKAVTYTADGSSNISISSLDFSPDFIWIKSRDLLANHVLWDRNRGAGVYVPSDFDSVNSETSQVQLASFDSNGFTVNYGAGQVNFSTNSYVAWCWKAGGTKQTNTSGGITSNVSVAASDFLSIVDYTGSGSASTVGHGLSAAPEMIMIKNRDQADSWAVYHEGIAGDAETDYLVLNTNAAAVDNINRWNDTAPTSSVFSVGTDDSVNASTERFIAYCFRSVEGLCKVGSYKGNGAADGAFVYCGFKPAYIMVKRSSSTGSWYLYDNARSVNNEIDDQVKAETQAIETTGSEEFDFLATGFKARTTDAEINGNTNTMVFIAFAEHPFGGINTTPVTAR